MNVKQLEATRKVIPFQRNLTSTAITLQIGDCAIHGIPEKITIKEFEALIATAKHATANHLENYWFNPNQPRQQFNEANIKGGERDVVSYVLKRWLNIYMEWRFDEGKKRYFEEQLAKLPALHQAIVTKKYLEVDIEGKQPLDDFVYGELHIGRTHYYKKKKEALYWLGKALLKEVVVPEK